MHRIMKAMVYLLYSTLGIVVLFGCTDSEIPFYKERYNAVRFPEKTEDNTETPGYDSDNQLFKANHSFIENQEAESFDYELPIELIGLIADSDRDVSYEIQANRSKAPAGSYKVLKSTIPAGKRSGAITIRLFNSPTLHSDEYYLAITLKGSEALAAGPPEYTRAILSWSMRIPAPVHPEHFKMYNALIDGHAVWNSKSEDYFSPNALRVIVNALKWYDWDDNKKHGNNRNGTRYYNYKYLPRLEIFSRGYQYKAYALTIADYIKTYNEKHPDAPLLHDAGMNKGKPIKAREYMN